MNNLEFDHADIFDDLEAIKRQFHHLIRTVPGNGRIFAPNRIVLLKMYCLAAVGVKRNLLVKRRIGALKS